MPEMPREWIVKRVTGLDWRSDPLNPLDHLRGVDA